MAFLRAFGSWLPSRRVTNEELAPLVDATPEWILQVSGIEERRYAAADETVASVGLKAAQGCLEKAGAAAADLGLILVASAGSLIGLAFAAQLAPAAKQVLVVGAEIMSRRVTRSPEGKNTAILFGDGAGACLVDAEAGFARIADSCLYTDGASSEILFVRDDRLHMDGQAVILQAARKIPRAINELLARNQLAAANVEAFLLHQANLNLITRVAGALKAPPSRFFTNIARYGNTSSASMLIAADDWWSGRYGLLSGPLVFSAFGAGLNWGALLALPR